MQPLRLNSQGIQTQVIELIKPVTSRRLPACKAFPACGSCHYQHWQETEVSVWKKTQVKAVLKRANVWPVQMRPFRTVPLNNRRRAIFHLKRFTNGVVAGFNERQGPQIITPESCVVLHPVHLALLEKLWNFAAREFPIGSSVDAQVNRLDQGLCVQLHATSNRTGFETIPALLTALGKWADDAKLARLSLVPGTGSERTTRGTAQALPLYVPLPPTVNFGNIAVTPPPGAFLQASLEAEVAL